MRNKREQHARKPPIPREFGRLVPARQEEHGEVVDICAGGAGADEAADALQCGIGIVAPQNIGGVKSGGAELLGTQFRLINGFGAGYGFDGVAMALIGQLHPIATVIVALFFAALRVGSTTMQAATGVPTSVSDIIQALVIVFSVAGMALTKLPEFESWKSRLFSGKRKAGDK